MQGVLKDAHDMPLSALDRAAIVDGRERRAKTPGAANHFLHTMRAMFAWAVENGRVAKDPTEGVKNMKRPAGGYHAWTETEIDRFEARWPVGTREQLAFTILLYTGLRRGDAAILGRQHVSDGVILMRAEKTRSPLAIPILPELARVIDANENGGSDVRHDLDRDADAEEVVWQLVSRSVPGGGCPRLRSWAP